MTIDASAFRIRYVGGGPLDGTVSTVPRPIFGGGSYCMYVSDLRGLCHIYVSQLAYHDHTASLDLHYRTVAYRIGDFPSTPFLARGDSMPGDVCVSYLGGPMGGQTRHVARESLSEWCYPFTVIPYDSGAAYIYQSVIAWDGGDSLTVHLAATIQPRNEQGASLCMAFVDFLLSRQHAPDDSDFDGLDGWLTPRDFGGGHND